MTLHEDFGKVLLRRSFPCLVTAWGNFIFSFDLNQIMLKHGILESARGEGVIIPPIFRNLNSVCTWKTTLRRTWTGKIQSWQCACKMREKEIKAKVNEKLSFSLSYPDINSMSWQERGCIFLHMLKNRLPVLIEWVVMYLGAWFRKP